CVPALERTGTFEGEWQVRRKDGSPWWCQISAKALNPAHLGQGTIWFFLDISPRKPADEEVQRSLLRERQLADLKMRFVPLASHAGPSRHTRNPGASVSKRAATRTHACSTRSCFITCSAIPWAMQ